MTQKRPYSYTVLRYVHDAMTGEFLNVGVVLHIPGAALLRVKTRKTVGRLKDVFPDLDRGAFKAAADSVDRAVRALTTSLREEGLRQTDWDAASLARKALSTDDSSLQWSPVGAGVTDDATQTLERLFARMVTRYDNKALHRRTDEDVWRPVRTKLLERGVKVDLHETVITGANDQIEFKHAWKNGKWHAYEPVSLDLADADGIKDKARRWLGHLTAVADGASEPLKLHFILGAPQNRNLCPAYENARRLLEQAPFNPEIFEEGQIDDLVSQIEDEVRAHDATSPGGRAT
jgi:hypothetical protein